MNYNRTDKGSYKDYKPSDDPVERVVQLIPAPPGLWTSWSMRGNPDKKENVLIVGFALIELDVAPYQEIRPIYVSKNGVSWIVQQSASVVFHGCGFRDIPPEWVDPKDE